MSDAAARRELLKEVWEDARVCRACSLHETRTTVVFGAGNADADLMFVGEAPGANEDKQGLPFVGQAGKLLNQLLEEIGLERSDVFIANTLKCLRYNAQVQLGDGTWERISRLVNSRYSGTVMSVNAQGELEPRRVTGWHSSPVAGRTVFKLTFAGAKRAGAHKVGVQLTGDHPVLTERGYVQVQDLVAGDRIATGQGVSELAWDVVCGSVLGDSSIQRKSSCLSAAHSAKQREYAEFKAGLLSEFGATTADVQTAAVAGEGRQLYDSVHIRTLAARSLRLIRNDFYSDKKHVPEWMAHDLSPRMLAFWFMDDGYIRIRGGGRRPLAEIATNSFDDRDLQILLTGLRRLGLVAKTLRNKIFFGADATEELSELIAPYVPESMRYKLCPQVAERIPFDPTCFATGETRALFDEVEVEDITHHPRADTTFFCIDVEENHNFVTAGGVVHNCRPPDNRNPLPLELDACQKYLFKQLELIQPTVVCTLGNFSTKLLRGDTTGISKLHGQEEIRQIGPRNVRLYPLYHPAAALYTRATLEVLREDFARIPELLALGPPPQPDPEPETGLVSSDDVEAGGAVPIPSLQLSGESHIDHRDDPGKPDSGPGQPPDDGDDSGQQLGLF